jgi:HAD superfamily hydrolase (TIGR01549 family)
MIWIWSYAASIPCRNDAGSVALSGAPAAPGVDAVVFDVGETLIDETRHWGEWADWLAIPRFTFFGVLGGVIGRGEDHRRVFDLVAPGLDVAAAIEERRSNGSRATFEAADLYADAAPCLRELAERGYRVGMAANQPEGAVQGLAALGVRADFVGSSADWGVWKPSPLFFRNVAEAAGCPPERIAYVGDRVDNDVVPAATAGMVPVFVRRGPWGYLHSERPEASIACVRVNSLAELPDALADV